MLWPIARHELRQFWRDRRFCTAATLVAAPLLAAVLTGWSHQRALSAEPELRASSPEISYP